MEKRLTLFFVLSVAILLGHQMVMSWLNPPRPKPAEEVAQQDAEAGDDNGPATKANGDAGAESPAAEGEKPATEPSAEDGKPSEPEGSAEKPAGQPAETEKAKDEQVVEPQWATLGSLDPTTGYRLLVTLTNRGGAIERVEITSPRYRDLTAKEGYLGNLRLESVAGGAGARIRVVGAGTPAALAVPQGSAQVAAGLAAGDVVVEVNGEAVADAAEFEAKLLASRPGDAWKLRVKRGDETLPFEVTLGRTPLAVLKPERQGASDPLDGNPASCLFSLAAVGAAGKQTTPAKGANEIAGLPSLVDANWEVTRATPELVEFRRKVPAKALAAIQQSGDLEVIRRYRLTPAPAEQLDNPAHPAYHIEMEVELRSTSPKGLSVAGKLTGPNGLPIEGWWYTTKISGQWFSSGGARDLVRRTDGLGHELTTCQEVYKEATANSKDGRRVKTLITSSDPQPERTVRYMGVDAQYFAAILLPQADDPAGVTFREASAVGVGDLTGLDKSLARTANVSFELTTESRLVKAGDPWVQSYRLFAGPKMPDLLAEYGESTPAGAYDLGALLEYGWFGWVARPLSRILHGIHAVVGNYGIAIVLLTVLVRSCMLPISHRAAKNTQKMQQLAPEMKKIAELYKNDMEKRGRAQQELYRKHGINPFSGCLLALCQLPIFIGLYRCISVDIELRQASLISGWDWASNLSGPDMLFQWDNILPATLAAETGYLGPYFNLFPLITIGLFLFNQRMLTPPPTDEQTRLQHNIMMGMTVFIGVMFFKVPAGLCTYFVSSSIWSLAEHKLLRKNKTGLPANADKGGGNGVSERNSKR